MSLSSIGSRRKRDGRTTRGRGRDESRYQISTEQEAEEKRESHLTRRVIDDARGSLLLSSA